MKMYVFRDYYNNEVKLSFEKNPFSEEPMHVLVICRYQDKWLLTKHKTRGLEFPGGKVEENETAQEAAIREVKEETGANIAAIHYIGQYHVEGKGDQVDKNIYYARISEIVEQPTYYETDGPVLLEKLPKNIKQKRQFSFIMKDDIVKRSLEQINKKFKD